jgi:hypothetical protein
MTTKIDVFVGAPIEVESERRFLSRLCADLKAKRQGAVVFANFLVPPQRPLHQIDFLVILERLVCHVELKNLTAPVIGGVNGAWQLLLPNGSQMSLQGNPYRQALDCKYALSDQMHRFAKQRLSHADQSNNAKFYKQIDSVVCVSPSLLRGSRVPSDVRVGVHGYPELVEHLTTRALSPGWSIADWMQFAMDLGLLRQEEFTDTSAEAASAEEMICSYRRRFRNYHESPSSCLVPTTLEYPDRTGTSNECFTFLEQNRHGQLVGASGSGKSLHAKYMAVRSLDAGRLPILLRAIDYSGKLSSLLDRSVAHLCPRNSTEFIESARRLGKPLTFVVDGFNECPARLKDGLLRDLHAAYLRWGIPILFTTQEVISLPKEISGDVLRFREPDKTQRLAILSQHAQIPLPSNVDSLCAPFISAYELSLAAACLTEIGPTPTRAGLFAAYIRRRCGDAIDPALVNRVLSELAHVMLSRLQSSITVDEMWQLGERVLQDQSAALRRLQDVAECGL